MSHLILQFNSRYTAILLCSPLPLVALSMTEVSRLRGIMLSLARPQSIVPVWFASVAE